MLEQKTSVEMAVKTCLILLKGFRSKGLLWGGGTVAASELLFPPILLKQKGAEISELQINTKRCDVESLDKMLIGFW